MISSTGLPLRISPGATALLPISVMIPPNTTLGGHLVIATVVWESSDPYASQDGWPRSPVTLTQELVVGDLSVTPGNSLIGRIVNHVKDLIIPGIAVDLGLATIVALLVVRSQRSKRRRPA